MHMEYAVRVQQKNPTPGSGQVWKLTVKLFLAEIDSPAFYFLALIIIGITSHFPIN